MFHLETVSPALLKIIRAVSSDPVFQDFRLVGGTALSLILGHRVSVDADFFSENPFDNRQAETALNRLLPGFVVMKESPHGFAGIYQAVKVEVLPPICYKKAYQPVFFQILHWPAARQIPENRKIKSGWAWEKYRAHKTRYAQIIRETRNTGHSTPP